MKSDIQKLNKLIKDNSGSDEEVKLFIEEDCSVEIFYKESKNIVVVAMIFDLNPKVLLFIEVEHPFDISRIYMSKAADIEGPTFTDIELSDDSLPYCLAKDVIEIFGEKIENLFSSKYNENTSKSCEEDLQLFKKMCVIGEKIGREKKLNRFNDAVIDVRILVYSGNKFGVSSYILNAIDYKLMGSGSNFWAALYEIQEQLGARVFLRRDFEKLEELLDDIKQPSEEYLIELWEKLNCSKFAGLLTSHKPITEKFRLDDLLIIGENSPYVKNCDDEGNRIKNNLKRVLKQLVTKRLKI